ncbi:RNA polymerase sigma factor [Enterococcus sp. AZ126]|uniref:RNA polymerase sigma factor n=1 Tax=Enterococcus sp. AZ126 TaxID=2774635 RepID=UPI003F20552A
MQKNVDVHLVKKAKKGNSQAFLELCIAYQDILYNSAYKILLNDEDVADCMQETEIRAWQKITKLKKEEAFNSWIFQIMTNIAKDILKKRTANAESEERYMSDKIETYNTFDIDQELNRLEENYRIPLILYYYAGFSIKEISEQLKISVNTVKTRLARGKLKLKILLEESNDG